MSEDIPIHIVHISDLHIRQGRESEFKKRAKAFFVDLERLKISPDLLVITGDIAFSGKSIEYDLARDLFFDPLRRRLRLDKKKIVLCPGNHDIDRTAIEPMAEKGLQDSILTTEDADSYLDHEMHVLPLTENYRSFAAKLYGRKFPVTRFSHNIDVNGISIGIASYDSAWRCTNNDSKERIFLTLKQVSELSAKIENSLLKIAAMHHPHDWLHPSERDVVISDLFCQHDIVLTGHLHTPQSYGVTNPQTEYIQITSPAFFEGQVSGVQDGYNIYSIKVLDRELLAFYRRFFRQRTAFDKNVEHAENGQATFALQTRSVAEFASAALVQKITTSGDFLLEKVKSSLRDVQRIDEPVFVAPLAKELTWGDEGKKYARIADPMNIARKENCIVQGPADVGTTVFLQCIAADINKERNQRYALFIDHRSNPIPAKNDKAVVRLVLPDLVWVN